MMGSTSKNEYLNEDLGSVRGLGGAKYLRVGPQEIAFGGTSLNWGRKYIYKKINILITKFQMGFLMTETKAGK